MRSRRPDQPDERANAQDPAMVCEDHFGGVYHVFVVFVRLIAAPSAAKW
jgi:hypothetical protein